jgi:peptidoglycan/LPS O-acetylase OafA/YrhL
MLLIFATQFYLCDPWPTRIIFLIINLLFIGLVYRNGLLSLLDKPLIRRVGALSYSTYLIHEMLGVLFINKIGPYFGSWSPITPFITILMAFGFAEMSYRVYEKPVTAFLKRCLFKPASLPISSEPAVKEIAPN